MGVTKKMQTDDILNYHVWRVQAAVASADPKRNNMFQTFSTVMAVYHQYTTENRSNQRLAAMLKECIFFSEGGHLGRFCNVVTCQSVLLHRLRFGEIMCWIVFQRMSRTQNTTLSNSSPMPNASQITVRPYPQKPKKRRPRIRIRSTWAVNENLCLFFGTRWFTFFPAVARPR